MYRLQTILQIAMKNHMSNGYYSDMRSKKPHLLNEAFV